MRGQQSTRAALTVALAYALLGGAGCAGWQAAAKATIASTHEATKAVTKIAGPAWDLRCSTKAKACKAAGDAACAPLVECEKQFREFNDATRAIHSAVAAALLLVAIEHEQGALRAVIAAGAHLKALYGLAKKYGVLVLTQ